jgi:Uri superfamily endonuclease
MNNEQLTTERGSYILVLEVKQARTLTVGRLGKVKLPTGVYAYAGSAFGSGGLRARLGRHLRGDGTRHWHIDYVRAVAEVCACFYTVSDRRLECTWSQALAALPGALVPAPGLGASDCRSGCSAHLIAFLPDIDLNVIARTLTHSARRPISHLPVA